VARFDNKLAQASKRKAQPSLKIGRAFTHFGPAKRPAWPVVGSAHPGDVGRAMRSAWRSDKE